MFSEDLGIVLEVASSVVDEVKSAYTDAGVHVAVLGRTLLEEDKVYRVAGERMRFEVVGQILLQQNKVW